MAADFFAVPTATCRLLFVLVVLAHRAPADRARGRHRHRTVAWTAQQLREAFPWDKAPRRLVRDRDHAFDAWAKSATAMDIDTTALSHTRPNRTNLRLQFQPDAHGRSGS
jgi:putative transposase